MNDVEGAPSEPPAESGAPREPVWTYRGYQLRSSEFTTAMVHFYRAEIQRSNTWRMRLDNTTNWAVVTAGAAITFALSDPGHHHAVIPIDVLLVTLFLWMEARRYRYYELWSYRARLLETDFFAAMLVPPWGPQAEWGESLAESLLQPQFPISLWEAFGRRFRRNYVWIFMVLDISWLLKGFLHPAPVASWTDFVSRCAIGSIPGEVVIAVGLAYNIVLFLVGFVTAGLQAATGEVLPRYGELPIMSSLWTKLDRLLHPGRGRTPGAEPPEREGAKAKSPPSGTSPEGETKRAKHEAREGRERGPRPARRGARRRQQLMVLIVTSQPRRIADRVLGEMRRGVTGLHGQGMYTGAAREVLMVVLTVTEVEQLKAIIRAEDPDALVIVSPAQQVLGREFEPLADVG